MCRSGKTFPSPFEVHVLKFARYDIIGVSIPVSVPFRGSRSEIQSDYDLLEYLINVSVPFRGSRSEIRTLPMAMAQRASFRPLSGFTF